MVPPVLNGFAVFAPKHALAMAHAIKGGKRKVREKWPTVQPQAGGSEHLELHGASSIALRAPGAALLSVLSTCVTKQTKDIRYKCLARVNRRYSNFVLVLVLVLKTSTRRRGRGNVVIPKGFPKSMGRGGSRALWLSMLSILCHFHGLLVLQCLG